MKIIRLITLLIALSSTAAACGQRYKGHKHENSKNMDTSIIKNTKVKEAVDAFQASNVNKWLSLFAENAILLDDGSPRDLKEFSTEAIKIERFTSIDKIEDNGNSVYGQFHSDKWGDFKAYFKFHFDTEGKISKLEIGQAKY